MKPIPHEKMTSALNQCNGCGQNIRGKTHHTKAEPYPTSYCCECLEHSQCEPKGDANIDLHRD